MTAVVFLRGELVLAEVEAAPGDALIDVARCHDIPLHWRCGQGTCGTCAVRIRHAAQPQQVEVGRKERNVLLRAGLADTVAAGQARWPDTPSVVRLACHLQLTAQPWQVLLPEDN